MHHKDMTIVHNQLHKVVHKNNQAWCNTHQESLTCNMLPGKAQNLSNEHKIDFRPSLSIVAAWRHKVTTPVAGFVEGRMASKASKARKANKANKKQAKQTKQNNEKQTSSKIN